MVLQFREIPRVVLWNRLVYSVLYHLSGAGDLLLANACGNGGCALYALDARSGADLATIGTTDAAGNLRGTATINGGRIYVATAAEGVKVFGLP